MDILIILSTVAGFVILTVVIIFQQVRYRRMTRKKDGDIIYHIHEQDRLSREWEHIRIENEILMKLLKDKNSGKNPVFETKTNANTQYDNE
ncbi:MAG: hypothetical protein LBN93_08075 [Candidatus Symbiothrix sp.]|jgi:uncharacterized membrane protein|nr:hypothetical protein [Candidatus Symbiothrix sp.]